MKNLDVPSMLLMLCVGNLLYACILGVFKSKTISQQLYRRFIAAKVLQSLAWLLLSLRGDIPDLFSVYFGNTFLSVGLGFEALALTTVYKQSRRWETIYLTITVLGIILMWAFSQKPNMRIAITSINAAVIFSIASYALIHSSFHSILRKTIGGIYAVLSIFLMIRSGYAFLATESFGLKSPHLVQTLAFFVTFILMLVSGVGFQLILSEFNDSILDESHRMFKNAIELLPIGCIIADPQNNTKYLNHTFSKQYGYTIDDIPNKQIWYEKAYPDPEYRKYVRTIWESDIDRLNNLSHSAEPFVFTITTKQGTTHVVEFRQSLVGTDLMVLLLDITERKRAEQALKDSEEKYKEAQLVGKVGHWEYNFVTQKLKWSDQIYRLYEHSKDDFVPDLNKAFASTHIDDQKNLATQFYKSIENRTIFEVESRIITANGEIKHLITRGLPKYDEKGKPVNMLATIVDITERKKAEQTIKQQKNLMPTKTAANSCTRFTQSI